MANEFVARNGLIAQNNSTVTGSLTVTGGITGSLLGTASTASFVQTAQTASYVLNAVSSSFATLAQTANTASFVTTAQTASFVAWANVNETTTDIFLGTASYASQALSSSFSTTASYALNSTGGGNVATSNNTGSIVLTLDGQGGVITIGQKNYSRLSYSGSFVGWNLMCSPTGALEIDVWVTSSQTSYPTGSNTITDAQRPFITASFITSSTNLTNWTSSFDNGYIIGFNVTTSSLCTWARLELITHKYI